LLWSLKACSLKACIFAWSQWLNPLATHTHIQREREREREREESNSRCLMLWHGNELTGQEESKLNNFSIHSTKQLYYFLLSMISWQ
jgi:hypothetical protein